MTALVNVFVVPVPLRSGVKSDASPDWQTANVAFSSLQHATVWIYVFILAGQSDETVLQHMKVEASQSETRTM